MTISGSVVRGRGFILSGSTGSSVFFCFVNFEAGLPAHHGAVGGPGFWSHTDVNFDFQLHQLCDLGQITQLLDFSEF